MIDNNTKNMSKLINSIKKGIDYKEENKEEKEDVNEEDKEEEEINEDNKEIKNEKYIKINEEINEIKENKDIKINEDKDVIKKNEEIYRKYRRYQKIQKNNKELNENIQKMTIKSKGIENEERESDKNENEKIKEIYYYFESLYFISSFLEEEIFSEKVKELNFDKDKIENYVLENI